MASSYYHASPIPNRPMSSNPHPKPHVWIKSRFWAMPEWSKCPGLTGTKQKFRCPEIIFHPNPKWSKVSQPLSRFIIVRPIPKNFPRPVTRIIITSSKAACLNLGSHNHLRRSSPEEPHRVGLKGDGFIRLNLSISTLMSPRRRRVTGFYVTKSTAIQRNSVGYVTWAKCPIEPICPRRLVQVKSAPLYLVRLPGAIISEDDRYSQIDNRGAGGCGGGKPVRDYRTLLLDPGAGHRNRSRVAGRGTSGNAASPGMQRLAHRRNRAISYNICNQPDYLPPADTLGAASGVAGAAVGGYGVSGVGDGGVMQPNGLIFII